MQNIKYSLWLSKKNMLLKQSNQQGMILSPNHSREWLLLDKPFNPLQGSQLTLRQNNPTLRLNQAIKDSRAAKAVSLNTILKWLTPQSRAQTVSLKWPRVTQRLLKLRKTLLEHGDHPLYKTIKIASPKVIRLDFNRHLLVCSRLEQ